MASPTSPDRFFQDRYRVSPTAPEATPGSALSRHADYGDLYFEYRTTAAVTLEDGRVKKASKDGSQGAGARWLSGEETGYAPRQDVVAATTARRAGAAGHIGGDAGGSQAVALRAAPPPRDLYALPASPAETPLPQSITLLEAIDREARRHDPRIKNVMA